MEWRFQLPNGSYSESDIQDYFGYIIKMHETVTDDPSIMIHVNKLENRITFKTKTGYYFVSFTPETVQLLGSTKSKITKDEYVENVPHLEIAEDISLL